MSSAPSDQTPASSKPGAAAASKPAAEASAFPSLKDTLNLPKTGFAMKANLVQNEPASMKRWDALHAGGATGLYASLRHREQATPSPRGRFVFHDGPPYANGSIHMGHLMNKVLKDIVVRSRTLMGFDVPYVPGWDCHGLPIEHKVMTEMVAKGKWDKLKTLGEEQRSTVIRKECQAYAEKYIKLQGGQMQRLLTLADYADPYLTMQPRFEAASIELLADLVGQHLVFRALKPVHWSIANQTALAEAELEYEDRVDLSVYVDFEAADADAVYDAFGLPREKEAAEGEEVEIDEGGAPEPGNRPGTRPSFMIWTTTPWTLPANCAIAVNPKYEYALVWVDGAVTVLATELAEKVLQLARSEEVVILARTSGEKLLGLKYRHPFVDLARGEGAPVAAGGNRDKLFTIMGADYVTLEDGTGLVHTAPGHGAEDYQTGLREGLPVYCPVQGDGTYDATVPSWLKGLDVWAANEKVAEHLRNSGHLFYEQKFSHSYPHDWRSKTPTIFRCTEQWFVGVDRPTKHGRTLRELALDSAGHSRTGPAGAPPAKPTGVDFVPEWGRNRMRGMLESRPDWCISRQRSWGLPIPAFFLPDGSVFMTRASTLAVAAVFRKHGADSWFSMTPAELLAGYDASKDADAPAGVASKLGDLKKGKDILDVWFESGSTWNAVMRERSGGKDFPIDLYLEGSDQHRGWFQSSLLPSVAMMGEPAFKTLLTHGFMVDKDGRKMSKSLGNTLEVEDILKEFGADVCRWWVSTLAFENDIKVDKAYLVTAGQAYTKIRNTLRFMLSNLYDFVPSKPGSEGHGGNSDGHCVKLDSLSPTSLEAWVLGEFDELSTKVTEAYAKYEFRTASTLIYDFCSDTLSARYLMAIKDRLYCDAAGSARRRATQTVLFDLTDGLCRLLAPVMCHTADEAYRALHQCPADDASTCVHLQRFMGSLCVKRDDRWPAVMALRERALAKMEAARAGIDNPLDMGVVLPNENGVLTGFDHTDLADLLGVSRVQVVASGEISVADLRSEPRCERSRKRDGTVKPREQFGGAPLSERDAQAVAMARL
jgi:isoleucyl-tRNA synthetase